MLILIEWKNTGGLFRLADGRRVFKTFEELEENYLGFEYKSPQGEKQDQEVFIWRHYFD